MSESTQRELRKIERLALRAEGRIRFGRALESWTAAFCVALIVGIAVLILRKTNIIAEPRARLFLILLGVGTFVVAGIAYARRLPARAGAVALDRFHGLHDRL